MGKLAPSLAPQSYCSPCRLPGPSFTAVNPPLCQMPPAQDEKSFSIRHRNAWNPIGRGGLADSRGLSR